MKALSASQLWKLGCFLLFLSVVLGAFAAHALKEVLDPTAKEWWALAVSYQRTHALALLACASVYPWIDNLNRLQWVARLLVIGIVFFCGSLYVMAISKIKILGAITPIGGSAWIIAWLLACSLRWKSDKEAI